MDFIDLRSDTVTRPTPGMRQAMMDAVVGDDVFLEDDTMNRFEKRIARMFGKEAGLFVPSGTMSNQIGLNLLTNPGDEVLIEQAGHVFNYEGGAASHLSSIQLNPLYGKDGKLDTDLLNAAGRGGLDWEPRPAVISIENTTNKGGGVCYTWDEMVQIRDYASQNGFYVHLDGARIWNALAETSVDAKMLGMIADTISVCFSKGLGAPVGSMLLSDEARINRARRVRKMLGGGMRQVGMLAAAADYAVSNHWPLLRHDHERAYKLAETINRSNGLNIDMDTVETNILIFDTFESTAKETVELLEEYGILMSPFGRHTLRATFHLDIDDKDLNHACKVINDLF